MKLSKNTLNQIKTKIKKLVKNGDSEEHALSLICDRNNLNIEDVASQIDIKISGKKHEYKDIKNSEGSYVMLKKKPENQYEVININNKDAIIIRNLDDNSELKVSEDEIIPVVTESKMDKKLNEAQYTVSIDNLETTDAETLSQMLQLAGEAENGVETSAEEVGEPIPGADLPPMEEPEIGDTEVVSVDSFEPTISAEMDGPGFEAAEIDNFEEPYVDDENASSELPPPDDNVTVEECGISDNTLDESEDLSEDMLKTPEEAEEEKMNEGEEEVLDETEEELFTESEEELTEEDMEQEIAETLRLAGVQINEVSDETANKGKKDLPMVAVEPNADPADKEQNGFESGENQRPNPFEHSIESSSAKDAQQQGRPDPASIHVCEMVSKDRINAICETASRMYAKKDKSEWLALDRRYVEKLIKEGVGYSRASKMILKAKAGK